MAKRNKKLAKRGLPPVTAEYDPKKPKPTLDELKAMFKEDFDKGLGCRMPRDKEALKKKRQGKLKLHCRIVGYVTLNSQSDPYIVCHNQHNTAHNTQQAAKNHLPPKKREGKREKKSQKQNKKEQKNKDNHFCVVRCDRATSWSRGLGCRR